MKEKVCICLLTLSLSIPVQAAVIDGDTVDEKKIIMKEVVVTATRADQQYQKVPASIIVITSEDIATSGAQTIPELLETVPGVVILDLDGTGLFQKVDIGGFGDTSDRHVAVTVNGRKINPIDLSNVSWAALPVENIERIEVLYGGGGVLYGDNAMGGVVNIITKQATKSGIYTNADAHYGSFNTTGISVAVDAVKDIFGVHVGGMYNETEGYREHSTSRRSSAFADVRVDPTDATTLFGMINLKTDDYEMPDALTAAQMEQDRRQASPDSTGEGEGRENSLSGGFEYYLSPVSTLRADLSFQNRDSESRWQGTYFGFPWSSKTEYENRNIMFSPQYIYKKPIADHENRLILGVDISDTDYESISSYGYTFIVDHRVYSFYAQNELQLSDALLLQLGARYEKPEYTMNYDNPGSSISTQSTLNDKEWALTLGLAYAFDSQSKLYANMHRSFRYPRADEFVSLFNGTFNANLKQEKAVGYEAGVHWLSAADTELRLRVFLTRVSNEIIYNDSSGLNENLEDSKRLGGELNFTYPVSESIAFYSGISLMQAEIDSGSNKGNEVPLVPVWKANFGVDIQPIDGFVCNIVYNYVDKRYMGNDLQNNQGQLEEYQTVDFSLNYTMRNKITIYVNARNIFNEKYENGYYDTWGGKKFYPMPEAKYMVGLRLNY